MRPLANSKQCILGDKLIKLNRGDVKVKDAVLQGQKDQLSKINKEFQNRLRLTTGMQTLEIFRVPMENPFMICLPRKDKNLFITRGLTPREQTFLSTWKILLLKVGFTTSTTFAFSRF